MAPIRKPVVAGNWKMYTCRDEAAALAGGVVEGFARMPSDVDVVLCPPFTALDTVARVVRDSAVSLGAQNMHRENEGAFTGEVAASMLVDAGCGYVILGHSERRTLFDETSETVCGKTHAAIAAGLVPIVCVGETLDERKADKTKDVLAQQVEGSLNGLGEDAARIIVAYEPVWAIGTGLTASPAQAQEAHAFIRACLHKLLGRDIAAETRILYGGSVKPDNAGDLFKQPDIDGGLIGGAALKADSFLAIVASARDV